VCLYALIGVGVETIKAAAGIVASDVRDLRLIAHSPLYVAYRALRLDWFPALALLREWRQTPRGWNG
jgi:hypothetical protein